MGHLNYEDEGKAICKVGKKTLYINDKSIEDLNGYIFSTKGKLLNIYE